MVQAPEKEGHTLRETGWKRRPEGGEDAHRTTPGGAPFGDVTHGKQCLLALLRPFWVPAFVICSQKHLNKYKTAFSSVQFSRSVVPDSLRPHESQHTRPPCPSPTPGVHPNPCPSSRWCHPTISSSVVPFSSCLQSFPTSGSFPMSQLFASGGQNIGVSASTSVLPVNIQCWFPLGLTDLISLLSKGLSRVFSNTTVQKHQLKKKRHQFFSAQLSL